MGKFTKEIEGCKKTRRKLDITYVLECGLLGVVGYMLWRNGTKYGSNELSRELYEVMDKDIPEN